MKIFRLAPLLLAALLPLTGCRSDRESAEDNRVVVVAAKVHPAEVWSTFYNRRAGEQVFAVVTNPATDLFCQVRLTPDENGRLAPVFERRQSPGPPAMFLLKETKTGKAIQGVVYGLEQRIIPISKPVAEKRGGGEAIHAGYYLALSYSAGCRDIETNTFNVYFRLEVSYSISFTKEISDIKTELKQVEDVHL
ncbi:MAG: hypothetical protein AB7F32_12695 [Victivallaceae bacterium]